MSVAPPLISLQQVRCTFVSKDAPGQRYTAVRDVTLAVGAGEFVSVVGPTGCGKSTLLNVAAGLLAPSAGSVDVFGARLDGLNRRAGYMFQSDSLMPVATALGNVDRRARVPRRRRPGDAQALEWLKRVGLGGFGDRYPHQLSGGMRKRVALAQTLVLDPDIILMDEPFSALDVQTRQLMENEVLALWAEKKKAVLFITHDLDEAIALSDRVVCLSAGPDRIRSASSRSTCRGRATSPRSARRRASSSCTRRSGACCARRCSPATGSSSRHDATGAAA
jgi:NitT/TauT family transport system ATP-binding protein